MAKYSKDDRVDALATLKRVINSGEGTLLVTYKRGVSYRVDYVARNGEVSHLTYTYGVLMGQGVFNLDGVNTVRVSGYGFSVSDHIRGNIEHLLGLGANSLKVLAL